MSLPPEIIAPVFVSDPNEKSIHIHISIFTYEGAQIVDTFALVNSGATGDFINQDLVKKKGYQMQRLSQPLKAQNMDRSANQEGIIHHKVILYLCIAKTKERREFLVVNCEQENLILGLPWLWEINPLIDWTMGEVTISSISKTPQHNSLSQHFGEAALSAIQSYCCHWGSSWGLWGGLYHCFLY